MRLVILGGGESGVGTASKEKDMKFLYLISKDKGIIKFLLLME
jgi:hypothetical protein